MGPMFAGAYLSIRLAAARLYLHCGPLTSWPFVMGLQVALCALLGNYLSYSPEFVDSGHRAVSPIVRRAFLEAARYRNLGAAVSSPVDAL